MGPSHHRGFPAYLRSLVLILVLAVTIAARAGAEAPPVDVDPPEDVTPPPETPPRQDPPPRPDQPLLGPVELPRHLIENGVEELRIEPGSGSFRDPFSGFEFPSRVTVTPIDGSEHRLRATGSGGRKKLVFKIYGAALYVDETVYLGSYPLKVLLEEDVARRIVFRFKRNASHERLHEVFREAIDKVWNGRPGPDVEPDIKRMLGYFEGGIRKGETIEFTYLPEKGLYTSVAGVQKPLIANAILGRRIWEVWLGENPLSPDLRRDLVRFVSEEGVEIKGVERESLNR
jgi:hypothetical protein